eukprot:COSAG02_NODE_19492_length_879_cov_1.114103_2_plen_33_part_01
MSSGSQKRQSMVNTEPTAEVDIAACSERPWLGC